MVLVLPHCRDHASRLFNYSIRLATKTGTGRKLTRPQMTELILAGHDLSPLLVHDPVDVLCGRGADLLILNLRVVIDLL